jgi:hypothetical protein
LDLIWLNLIAEGDSHAVAEQTLIDILWASVRPEDKVEHISVRADGALGLLVAVFVRAGPPDEGSGAALRMARAATATSPTLAGWSVRLSPPASPEAAGWPAP